MNHFRGANQLAESNSTHVRLKQVTPASEATYKCEISADAPSFKTVSAERQLKVYVLPKRKLIIVNNGNGNSGSGSSSSSNNNNNNNNNNLSSSNPQLAPQSQYAVNDFINLTCVSAHSKPTASLRWLVNDAPADSEWLSLRHIGPTTMVPTSAMQAVGTNALYETQLTIAFRIQPTHLNARGLQPHASSRPAQARQRPTWLIQLRCVAQLDVEFVAETSIQLADGKTVHGKNGARKNQPQTTSPAPPPPPPRTHLPEPMRLSPADSGRSSFRTTRPTSHARAPALDSVELGAYRWPPVRQDQEPLLAGGAMGASLVVWTSGQLRAQSEHIEHLLARTRPNELGAPLIEAALRKVDPSDEPTDTQPVVEHIVDEADPSASAAALRWRQSDTFDSAPLAATPDGGADTEAEVLEFTCTPQFHSQERSLIRELRSVWLLNDQQVNGSRVNNYDGASFNHLPPNREKPNVTDVREMGRTPVRPATDQMRLAERSAATSGSTRVARSAEQLKLSVELSASLLQLKELNLKCRTTLVQPLIEFETQSVALVSTIASTTTQTSSPFIHAIDSNVDTAASQDPNTGSRYNRRPAASSHYQRRNPSAGRSSSNNHNNNNSDTGSNSNKNRPKQHWTSVIRLRQNPSSASASSRAAHASYPSDSSSSWPTSFARACAVARLATTLVATAAIALIDNRYL